MPRPGEQFRHGSQLHNLASIHHRHALAHLADHTEIVGDEQQGRTSLSLHLLDQRKDLCLDGHVQTGGRLVGDKQAWFTGEHHRHQHALGHAAAQLVGIGARARPSIRDAHVTQQLDSLLVSLLLGAATMQADRPGNLIAHSHQGIQRSAGTLKDHGNLGAAHFAQLALWQGQQVLSPKPDLPPFYPGRRRQQVDDGQ